MRQADDADGLTADRIDVAPAGSIRFGLGLDRLWVAIAILLPVLVSLLVPLPAVDLAYQVRAGNEILTTGAIPRVDTWTFTVWGAPWLDQQWLAQVALAMGHELGGWELLAVVRAVVVGATTALLVMTARAVGTGSRTAALLALAAFSLMAPALALRPQLFGIVLFAGLLVLVAGRRRWPDAYAIAPILIVLWANVHGSFVLGPALLGYAWLDDVVASRQGRRRSLWVLVVGSLATLANPYLFSAWAYAIGIGANAAIADQVSEWQRTSPLEMPGLLFYPSVAVTFGLMARRRVSVAWPAWLLAAGLALIGAWAVRGVAWWAVVMVLLIALAVAPRAEASQGATVDAAPRPRRALTPGMARLNALVVLVLGVAIVGALPWWRPSDPLTGRTGLLAYAPPASAAALAELRDGLRVVVPQTWGSWFEWAVPEHRYYIDARFELFSQDVWDGYAGLVAGAEEAREVIDRWGVDAVVVPIGGPEPAGPWADRIETADGTILVVAFP